MSRIANRLDAVRAKPHHVRRQLAFLASGVITGVIAIAWLGISLYTGAFALKGSNFAQITGAEPAATGSGDSGGGIDNSGVAGVGAAEAATGETVAPGLDVIGAGDSGGGTGGDQSDPQSAAQSGQNIIPF